MPAGVTTMMLPAGRCGALALLPEDSVGRRPRGSERRLCSAAHLERLVGIRSSATFDVVERQTCA